MHSTLVRPRRTFGAVAISGLTLALLLTAPALVRPAEAATAGGGFVFAHNPTAASYTPYSPYQYNSTSPFAAVNTITRSGVGSYTVRFPGLAVTGGTVHVTAYGSTTHRCKVSSWAPEGTAERVHVLCTTIAGARVDTTFTATFTSIQRVEAGRKLGYVWADNPTAASYTPATPYQANSAGAVNTVTRSAVGTYRVQMPGLGVARGHVQVTAYGGTADHCKTNGWGPTGTAQVIGVKCFTTAGAPVDSRYTLTYVDRTNILGLGVCCNPDGNESAYAWANNPTAASYVPSTSYQFADFTDTAGTITRSGVGAYGVKWDYINLDHGNVQVTAYGSTNTTCKVSGWNTPSGVQVRCFSATGAPADSMFDVAFTGPFVIG